MFSKRFAIPTGVLCLLAFSVPALADHWGFHFSYGSSPRYYRTYSYVAPSVVYYDPAPVVYDYYPSYPSTVVYESSPRVAYSSYYVPRTTVCRTYRTYAAPRTYCSTKTYYTRASYGSCDRSYHVYRPSYSHRSSFTYRSGGSHRHNDRGSRVHAHVRVRR